MLLEGKVAIVSGLGPGMGRDISLALAEQGADIVMGARKPESMAGPADEVRALGRRALEVPTDITDVAACENIAQRAKDEFGRVDVLVNNAFHQGDFSTLVDADLDSWRETFEVNFYGAMQLSRAAIPFLKEHEESHIVMINTVSVLEIQAAFGAYAASKGALATVTKTMARELGRDGIRVNAIHPDYIWGSSVEWYLNHLAEQNGTSFQEEYDKVADTNCLGYITPSSEIAGAVVFLASPLSRCVTGQALSVDAGRHHGGL